MTGILKYSTGFSYFTRITFNNSISKIRVELGSMDREPWGPYASSEGI
jgi:hypothetical protein